MSGGNIVLILRLSPWVDFLVCCCEEKGYIWGRNQSEMI